MTLFKLVGNDYVLKLHLKHPIYLDKVIDYNLTLTGFYSDNNVFNLKTDGKIYSLTALPTPKENFQSYIKEVAIKKG